MFFILDFGVSFWVSLVSWSVILSLCFCPHDMRFDCFAVYRLTCSHKSGFLEEGQELFFFFERESVCVE